MSFGHDYSVAVRLRLMDEATTGLLHLSKGFASAHGQAKALQGTIKQIKLTAMTGAALGITGAIGLGLLKQPLDSAKQFALEAQRFKALGLGEAMDRDAVKFVKGMDTIGTSLTENMALFRDAQTVFRDSDNLHHAEMVTPLLAKMKFANETLYGSEQGKAMEGKFMDMLRVIELRRGLNSPEEFKRQADMIQQVLTTSGGRVDSTQYLNLMKTGGTATKQLSNQALYYQLEPIIQELGGQRTGTALQTLYNRLNLGIGVSGTAANELLRLGILDKNKIETNSLGGFKRYKGGENALVQAELFQSSPIDYLEKVLLPAYKKAGITKESDILRTNALIGGRTGGNLLNTAYLQMNTIRKGEIMSAKAATIDQAEKEALATPQGREIALRQKLDALNTRLGLTILPLYTKAVGALIPMVQAISGFVEKHPTITKAIVLTFAGLSALALLGGGIMLFSAAVQGLSLALGLLLPGIIGLVAAVGWPITLIVGGLALLGAAIYGIVKHWDSSKSVWDNMKNIIGGFFKWLVNRVQWVATWLPGGGGDKRRGELDAELSPKPAASKPRRAPLMPEAPKPAASKPRRAPLMPEAPKPAAPTTRFIRTQGDGDASKPRRAPRSFAPTGRAATSRQPIVLKMDGKKVGEVVTGHQARAFAGTQFGTSGFDPNGSLAPVASGAR